jgi:tetratricopeptide (TPR) repeat protein
MTTFVEELLIVEAPAGLNRRRWLEERLQQMEGTGARTFSVCCDFDAGGPWAGVSGLFESLFAEIQAQRPDLIERHSLELVYLLPQLRKSLTVRNPNLTDLAPVEERTRNYPADRAFRNVHGLIDLLDSWKSKACPDQPWIIACDCYDAASTMGGLFFRELMRRRGERLHIKLLAGVDRGKGEATRASFSASLPAEVVAVDLAPGPATVTDSATAGRMASELEDRIGDDLIERQVHLSDLINLWRLAARPDKLLRYKAIGLEIFNTLGLYADALRYGDGLLELARKHAPDDERLRWAILLKLLMSHIGLNDVEICQRLAEEEGLKIIEGHPAWAVSLYYLMAMFYARFQKPRDLGKGEEYLGRSFEEIQRAGMAEGDFHFHSVFNRNGLAMIRSFQGRPQDAIDLCRDGIVELNEHLGSERHRLHRSILHYNTGQVYDAIGDYDKAIEYYSLAIAMDPNYSEYYNDRGAAFLQMGLLEEALADYLKAIELSPPYYEVFTNLGQCYRRMGAMADAIEAYTRALDLEPDHLLALLGRAKAQEERGRVTEAIADYSAALARDPAQWEAVASRGVMYYEAGNLEASLADFDRAIELKPEHGDLYQNRATVLTDLGRHQEAARDIRTTLRLNPPDEERPALQAKLKGALQAAFENQAAAVGTTA